MMNYKDKMRRHSRISSKELSLHHRPSIWKSSTRCMRTFELIPGGKEIFVTKENCADFIDKYIEFLFVKTSSVSPKSMHSRGAGFYKLFDEKMLKLLYTSEELSLLEQYDMIRRWFEGPRSTSKS